jgi:hypothetical protein
MKYEVRTIDGGEAIDSINVIKQLLSEFSEELHKQISEGHHDQLIVETCRSQNVRVCIAWDSHISQPVGMYIGTIMPVMLRRRLYVDYVLVIPSHRRQGICQQVLIPHMNWLAQVFSCSTIDMTSSKIDPQTLYRRMGFASPTTAFRKQIKF